MSNVFNLLGGGGGMKPVIRIHTSTGATVTCDGVVGTEVSGVWNFTTTIGSHTIVASMNGNTKTQTVLVDAIALYDITISLPRLPSGYQELSYIESTGTQYIDTGVLDYNDLDIVFEARSIDGGYLGARASFSLNTLYFDKWIESSVSKIGVRAGKNATKYTSEIDDSSVHTFNLTGSVFKIDDTIVSSSVSRDIDDFYNIYLFATNTAGTSIAYKQCVIYYCKLYSNNNLVRDFVPCYRKSDGEVGMYDLVNNTFYANNGTGSFRIGAIVDDDFTSTYQQVEYLESNGTPYIDTGAKFTQNNAVARCMFYTTSNNWHQAVCGSQNGSWSNWFIINYLGSGYYLGTTSSSITASTSLNTFYDLMLTVNNGTSNVVLNGQTYSGSYSGTIVSGSNVYLFAYSVAGGLSPSDKYYGRVYIFMLFSTGVSRIMVPCYRKSDSVAGMYDMANRVFYENAGTGSFIVGPEV